MTKAEACFILGVEENADDEHAIDQYLEKCFEIRKFIFRTPLVTKLASKRATQLLKMHRATDLLVAPENYPASSSKAFRSQLEHYKDSFNQFMASGELTETTSGARSADPTEIIEHFEQQEAQIKLLFSNVYTGDWLAFFLTRWVRLELDYNAQLVEKLEDQILEEAEPFKQADKLPTPELKKLLHGLAEEPNNAELNQRLSSELKRMIKAIKLGV